MSRGDPLNIHDKQSADILSGNLTVISIQCSSLKVYELQTAVENISVKDKLIRSASINHLEKVKDLWRIVPR